MSGLQEEKFPDVLDSVSLTLLSYLPKMPKMDEENFDAHGRMPTTYHNVQQPFTQLQGSVEPGTPRRSLAQERRDLSPIPPPAPKRKVSRHHVDKALKENDLVEVVDILMKDPKLANVPFFDGTNEFPLGRALRLQCDPMIIQFLEGHGAKIHGPEGAGNYHENNILPYLGA